MNFQQLNNYPHLHEVMSKTFRYEIESLLPILLKNKQMPFLNTYSLFLSISLGDTERPFSGIRILNDPVLFENHLKTLIGFIYRESEDSIGTTYSRSNDAKRVLMKLADTYRVSLLTPPKLSCRAISDDVQACIEQYEQLNINEKRFRYYKGWTVTSKEGKSHYINLVAFCDCYGDALTDTIHALIDNLTRTQIASTTTAIITNLKTILNGFPLIFKTESELQQVLKAEHSPLSMMRLFDVLLVKRVTSLSEYNKGRKKKTTQPVAIKSFFKKWPTLINHFTLCFIDSGFFEEPLLPFVIPQFKAEIKNKASVSVGGDLPDKIHDGLFSFIPLEIKDEQAIEIIKDRVNRDISHVRLIAEQWLDDINHKLKANEEYKHAGLVKLYLRKGNSSTRFDIGLDYPANTVATFYHHGYDCPASSYMSFLGCVGKSDELIPLLALPTTSTLHALCSLLVIEHPLITPSWLESWELLNKSGDRIGFKPVLDQWVATSYKSRRGSEYAEQKVILNDFSKKVVETLIQHTEFSRSELKKNGNDNYRFMLLRSTVTTCSRVTKLGLDITSRIRTGGTEFSHSLHTDSVDPDRHPILTKKQSERLVSTVHLRSLRSLMGLQVYLKTNSVKAVADALGHKEPNMDLLESYLPKPILAFFNDRWVRLFQNAIIFEAMKDSPLLITALDFNEGKLEEFLKNHGLKNLPAHLNKAASSASNEDNQQQIEQLDKVVFTISTGLLQVFIAITNIFEKADPNEALPPIVLRWYESACFVLSYLNTNKLEERAQKLSKIDLLPLYESAKQNPLCYTTLKEQLCR